MAKFYRCDDCGGEFDEGKGIIDGKFRADLPGFAKKGDVGVQISVDVNVDLCPVCFAKKLGGKNVFARTVDKDAKAPSDSGSGGVVPDRA